MEVSIVPILGWVATALGGAILAFLGWVGKKKYDQVDNHEIRISRLEETNVTPEVVRSIVHQSNEGLRQSILDVQAILNSNTQVMNSVLQEIAERKGYEKAMKELRERNDH